MCEQTEINYLEGEVVWVKLGSCWWPGEVFALEKLPPDVLRSFRNRKPPIACVKFFQEDAYEYVKNINNIYKYNCSRKNEFINKGLYLFRTRHGHMEKFPDDVIRAETAVGGDKDILSREEFQEPKKESYAGLFGDPKKTPSSAKKGKSGRGRPPAESLNVSTPRRQMKEKTDYKVHILVQGSKPAPNFETPLSEVTPTPCTSGTDLTGAEEKSQDENAPQNEDKLRNEHNSETLKATHNSSSISIPTTPLESTPPSSAPSSSGIYACHACPFKTTRLNVLILHNKTHSVSFVPYTPSPVRKKPAVKSPPKSTPNLSKTPKPRKPRKEKTEKKLPKKLQAKKRASEEQPLSVEVKKLKTDEEIKSSLLADWDDDVDEDSNDEASMIVCAQSPEVPMGAESPAVPTSAELPSAQVPAEISTTPDKKSNGSPTTEKPESSSDSKYEFCEDEDWPEEADFGRKIPRVKNPIPMEDPKGVAFDEDEVAREVAELLNKTAVPELPSVPETLKIEENFPEPSIVKSPDKNPDKRTEKSVDKDAIETRTTKAIFKTKTFFRSRHSRSQDVIGKYVAEQLNAVERMDISESEMNGSDVVSSPEARDSPPIEPVKVARLAPKIQLKKMKAEAAQLREKEKMSIEQAFEPLSFGQLCASAPDATKLPLSIPEATKVLSTMEETDKSESEAMPYRKPMQDVKTEKRTESEALSYRKPKQDVETEKTTESESLSYRKPMQDVLYPTQEIRPLNTETHLTFYTEVVEEQFTNKDALMEENITEFEKEHPNRKEEVVQLYKFEEEPPTLVKETRKLEKVTSELETGTSELETGSSELETETSELETETSEMDEATSEFEEITSRYEQGMSKFEVKTSEFKEDTNKFEEGSAKSKEFISEIEEKTSGFERENSKYVEEVVQTSRFDEETEIPTYEDEVVQTTKLEKEKSDFENVRPNFEVESSQYEAQIKEIEESSELPIADSTEIRRELILNQKPQVEESHALTTIKLSETELLEKEVHLTKTLKGQCTNDKSQDLIEPCINESTASAVDALLSVSRETDRVPRVVSNYLPEDLFEDENTDTDNIEHTVEVDNFNEKMETHNSFLAENGLEEQIVTEDVHHEVESTPDLPDESDNNVVETSNTEIMHSKEIVDTTIDISKHLDQEENNIESVVENMPSESDLQVAEALINLPSTAIQSQTPSEHKEPLIIPFSFDHENSQEEIVPVSENVLVNEAEIGFQEKEVIEEIVEHLPESMPICDSENLNTRFETEQEKSENLNAAQSLVQMSESIKHKINIVEPIESKEITEPKAFIAKQNNGINSSVNSVEQNVALLSQDNNSEKIKPKTSILNQSSSKLLKILEEPCKPKLSINKAPPTKTIIQAKDKILNFDVAKSAFKSKTPKQKIIIRRTATPKATLLNNANDLSGSDKIILSRSGNPSQEGSSVQTFTIQTSPDTPSDANTIIIQQKIRKITKPAVIQPKLQRIKTQTSLVAPMNELKTIDKTQTTDDAMFDINSMPIVLSEDLLTPESIEKMPVVMSDANIISQPQATTKIIKPKQNTVEHEKVVITSSTPHKQEMKTLLLNPAGEVSKSATPNILSKSSKLRGAKPMLVIDKATGKQKLIMTKTEPAIKEVKKSPTVVQPTTQASKSEKFIILPTQSSSPRPARSQKIVIDPQTGKAHVFIAKGSDAPLGASENKPVSAKLVPSHSDATAPGNTVMIITNAQGGQSRIVLTPEHEKILFPNKQQPNLSQLKSITHRITTTQKTVMASTAVKTPTIAPVKTPTRIVSKQKSAIITSKGQLIVGGRVATTAPNIAPMPELRPVSKRIVTSEPKKSTHTVQKTNSEPIIFLQQKSGAVMQLTAAQFEHLQRTGQIVQKAPAPVQEKIVIQKVKPANEPGPSIRSRVRKTATASPTPPKKIKHEIAIAPAPALAPAPAPPTIAPVPATVNVTPPTIIPSASNVVTIPSSSTTSGYSEFDNFEELLPSTAIARQPEPAAAEEPAAAPPAGISDQLLAVPGEHFGGLAGTFYLCVEDNGSFTPIDNRPLVLENNQLVPMEAPQPERRDILEAALANSDVFHADGARDEAPDFRDLNANVSVHCRVSETSTTLNQPIMTPVEVPSSAGERAVPASLEAGLAEIGVTPLAVPTSLELPITVTDPRIAPRTSDPLSGAAYGAPLLPSPGAELYEAGAGSISMPLLTAEEAVGKSMPILTDEVAASSPDADEGWSRRLLTPGSDCSEASVEIPLQPAIQLSVGDIHDRS